jgi:hypothetical protein
MVAEAQKGEGFSGGDVFMDRRTIDWDWARAW